MNKFNISDCLNMSVIRSLLSIIINTLLVLSLINELSRIFSVSLFLFI
jgi:hypothetical protein